MPPKILTRGVHSALGLGADRLVGGDRLQDVEQLPLVLVNPLDVDVEHRRRVDRDAGPLRDQRREPLLVGPLGAREALAKGAVLGQRRHGLELLEIGQPARADRFGDQVRQIRVALAQPAPRGDAVGLVGDAPGNARCSSLNTVRFISSVCSAETPLTLCAP